MQTEALYPVCGHLSQMFARFLSKTAHAKRAQERQEEFNSGYVDTHNANCYSRAALATVAVKPFASQ